MHDSHPSGIEDDVMRYWRDSRKNPATAHSGDTGRTTHAGELFRIST